MTAAAPKRSSQERIANLHAFARLYGVVRWFHPGDAAAAVDWNQFAIDGVRRVMQLPDGQGLRVALTELFAPIAPTVRIAASTERFPVEPALGPDASVEQVAWEHRGFGDSVAVSAYASKRRHRARVAAVPGMPYAALSQSVEAAPYRGARIRLRGQVRVARGGLGQLWLRVDRGDSSGFFDNMSRHPVVSPSWATAEIVGTVDADATRIVFGILMPGPGTAWYDELELAVQSADGTWTPIAISDPGFEAADPGATWKPGTASGRISSTEGWNVVRDSSNAAAGSASLRVEQAITSDLTELFSDAPEPGESADVELGAGLHARVPLILGAREGRTLGDGNAPGSAHTNSPAATPPELDVATGIADVIVVWNVFQHFWPYWDVVPTDWNAALDVALADAADDHSVTDHVATLQRLTAGAPDAHVSTTCRGEPETVPAPFAVEVIEDKLVVTATATEQIARGDVIVAIEGERAAARLQALEALVSGSPQWRRLRASDQFGRGAADSSLTLGIVRNGATLEVTVKRGATPRTEFAHPPIHRFDDGVYYIDLSRAPYTDISPILDQLAAAPGVVFDMRRYPKANTKLLPHLLTRPDDSGKWLAVPHVLRPDHTVRSFSGWDESGWSLPVESPHIGGRVAFLTGPGAASYAESLMSFVEHYRLGEIVGSPTAGTNGNVAVIGEPSGCRTRFSGLRVTKHDGTRLHLLGIQPTIPATRTIEGVIAGRDEVLERALAHVRGSR